MTVPLKYRIGINILRKETEIKERTFNGYMCMKHNAKLSSEMLRRYTRGSPSVCAEYQSRVKLWLEGASRLALLAYGGENTKIQSTHIPKIHPWEVKLPVL